MTNLESKVTSLPLSRKLAAAFKEKGIKPPESEFYWHRPSKHVSWEVRKRQTTVTKKYLENHTPAYLSIELLEGMPKYKEIDFEKCTLLIAPWSGSQWYVAYVTHDEENKRKSALNNKSLPNACGEMTLWLIDNSYYE